jgi:hypothetical protein
MQKPIVHQGQHRHQQSKQARVWGQHAYRGNTFAIRVFFVAKIHLRYFIFLTYNCFILYCPKQWCKAQMSVSKYQDKRGRRSKNLFACYRRKHNPVLLSEKNGTGKEQGSLCSSDLRFAQ